MWLNRKWVLLLFVLIATGCSSNSSNTTNNSPTEVSSDWGQILVDNRYLILNNVWNKAAATSGFYQKIFLKEVEGKKVFGWQWVNPFPYKGAVVSYPEVIYGDKPWDNPSGRATEFPFKANAKEITVNYKSTVTANGIYNTAFSLWAVSSLPASKEKITHEIMIWTVNSNMYSVGVRQVEPLVVNGVKFDVYVNYDHSDASGNHSNKWTFVAFVAQEPILNGPLNITLFTDYLLDHGLLSTDAYLTSLELGNEVVGGSGTVEIRDYQVNIK